jgi:hypothetical protein
VVGEVVAVAVMGVTGVRGPLLGRRDAGKQVWVLLVQVMELLPEVVAVAVVGEQAMLVVQITHTRPQLLILGAAVLLRQPRGMPVRVQV